MIDFTYYVSDKIQNYFFKDSLKIVICIVIKLRIIVLHNNTTSFWKVNN